MELKGKGYSLFYWKKYVTDNFGKEIFDKIIELTDKDVQDIYLGSLMSGTFYPIKAEYQFLEAFEKVLGRQAMIKMTVIEADKELGALFGLAAKFISIENALKRFQIFWDRAFQGGKIEMVEVNPPHYKIRVTEFIFNDAFRVHQENYLRRMGEIGKGHKFRSSSRMIDKTSIEITFEELDEPAEPTEKL